MSGTEADEALGTIQGCSLCTPHRTCSYHSLALRPVTVAQLVEAIMQLQRFGFDRDVPAPPTHLAHKRWIDAEEIEAVLQVALASQR